MSQPSEPAEEESSLVRELRQRIAALERDLAKERERVTEEVEAKCKLEETTTFLEGIILDSPVLLFVKDLESRYILVNKRFEEIAQIEKNDILGKTDVEFLPPEVAAQYMASDRLAIESEMPIMAEDVHPRDDTFIHVLTTKYPLRDRAGRIRAVCGISVDISERREAEAETQRLNEENLALKEATLRALSTPLLPIAPGVVIMPLIGNIEEHRADLVLETLLEGIVKHRARKVIVDVTGVPHVDSHVANALVYTARAVALLGARVILTGIQPAIAKTLVDLGVDLGDILTRSTLQSGIALALGRNHGV